MSPLNGNNRLESPLDFPIQRRHWHGARIGVRPLAAHRHTAAVPQTPVAAEIHQTLDIHCHFTAKLTLDPIVAVDHLADPGDLVIAELVDAHRPCDPGFFAYLGRRRTTDSVDIGQRDADRLVRKVDTRYARHANVSSEWE